jgi:Domain of unknown function (DUF4432)
MNALQRWTLIDNEHPSRSSSGKAPRIPVIDDDCWIVAPVNNGEFRFRLMKLSGGRREGVEVLEIETKTFRAAILPTRGMSLWKAWLDDFEVGWQSPVVGPIHPNFVPIYDPSGIGWLDGFDELVVRCGLESNGAPDFDAQGKLKHPLHGKIGNIPAQSLSVMVDPEAGSLAVVGTVCETRFLVRSLELQVHYNFQLHQPSIECVDTVTNRSTRPSSMQMLYHINVGSPVLEEGSRVVFPFSELAPRDARALEGIDCWDTYLGPTAGYSEQVYFARPLAASNGWSSSLLHNAARSRGVGLDFDTRTLPFLNLWKNTAAEQDGYVTGLEPATGFPNPRSFEEELGRVVGLLGGESRSFHWRLNILNGTEAVQEKLIDIAKLSATASASASGRIHRKPNPKWSRG